MDSIINLEVLASQLGVSIGVFIAIIAFISIWALVWKGLALWKAAQEKHKGWFIVMLVINDLGILEILYYFIFSKKKGTVTDTQTQ